jgi:hypothetical protein
MIHNAINENEATATDLRVIKELTENHGWKVGDTLLYQPQYSLTPETGPVSRSQINQTGYCASGHALHPFDCH